MDREKLELFERQVAALAFDYGVSTVGVTAMYHDSNTGQLQFAAAFHHSQLHPGCFRSYMLHRQAFDLAVSQVRSSPAATLVLEGEESITVVSQKKGGMESGF